jgi:hypothetical protein
LPFATHFRVPAPDSDGHHSPYPVKGDEELIEHLVSSSTAHPSYLHVPGGCHAQGPALRAGRPGESIEMIRSPSTARGGQRSGGWLAGWWAGMVGVGVRGRGKRSGRRISAQETEEQFRASASPGRLMQALPEAFPPEKCRHFSCSSERRHRIGLSPESHLLTETPFPTRNRVSPLTPCRPLLTPC